MVTLLKDKNDLHLQVQSVSTLYSEYTMLLNIVFLEFIYTLDLQMAFSWKRKSQVLFGISLNLQYSHEGTITSKLQMEKKRSKNVFNDITTLTWRKQLIGKPPNLIVSICFACFIPVLKYSPIFWMQIYELVFKFKTVILISVCISFPLPLRFSSKNLFVVLELNYQGIW